MIRFFLTAMTTALALPQSAASEAFALPADSKQLIVGLAEDWNSSSATLSFYRKEGGKWRAEGTPWQARLGRDGLAWGRGLHPVPPGVVTKKEGDMRSPAGVFELGGAWGYAASIRKHPKLSYRRVTPRDLWVEDPASPHYNRHLSLPHDPAGEWEKKQQMKQHDPAHALKLFIAHNAPPRVIPGEGSSIFFHIWRGGGSRATAGCTTMDATRLGELIARLDPGRQPLYVLLPEAEYQMRRPQWGLP